MGGETGQFYDFAPYSLDTKKRLLLRGGQAVPLTSKAFATLLLLVQNRQRVLEKDELMKTLWPDSFVEEANLAQNISTLRKALGESPGDHRFIVTVPGRGYQFVAEVRSADEEPQEVIVEKLTTSRVIVEETQAGDEPAGGIGEIGNGEAAGADQSGLRPDSGGLSQPPLDLALSARGAVAGRRDRRPTTLAWIVALGGLVAGLAVALVRSNVIGLRSHLMGKPTATPIRSIAVLPLENLSGDPSQEYFADGMTDELITDLAQIRALKVISRTSVMRYKGTKTPLPEIARQLNVDAVLEGAVTRFGNRARVTAQLIRADTDQHLWAEAYERDVRDVLALQDDVARDIATEVQIELTPEERTRLARVRPVNPEAHEAYLRGRYEWKKRTPEGLSKSVTYYERALAKDPGYALAEVGLADTYDIAGGYWGVGPKETMPKAEEAAKKALGLDDSLAEAHSALAMALANYEWDWARAEREFKRAIELDPNYATAHYYYAYFYLAPLGKFPEAEAEMKKALDLDPLSLIINANLGSVYYLEGRYDDAIRQEQKTLELDPGFPKAHYVLGSIYERRGMYEQAISEAEKYSFSDGLTPDEARAVRKAVESQGARGYWEERLRLPFQKEPMLTTRRLPLSISNLETGTRLLSGSTRRTMTKTTG